MKKISTFFMLFAFSLMTWQISAQSALQRIYSGESLPTEQGWQELKLDATINDVAAPTTLEVDNGVLRLISANEVDQFSQLAWYKTDLDFDLNKGFTILIKARVVDADKTAAFNLQGFDKNGKGFRVGILKDAVTELTNPFAATNVLSNGMTNNEEFHIYRLTSDPLTGMVEVFKDTESLGSFPLQKFEFDNIIENGGFEDAEFPDFISREGNLSIHSTTRAFAGQSSLLIDSDGKTNQMTPKEGVSTREFPVKPNTDYEFSMSRRRAIYDNEWAWRDLGIYWNTQSGSVKYDDITENDPNVRWWNNPFEDLNWRTGTEVFNKHDDDAIQTVRFEFPSWARDGHKTTSKVLIDNISLSEKLGINVGHDPGHGFPAPLFPEGYVNIIQNGGFEDYHTNNDGTPYEWELSDPTKVNDNNPTKYNEMWGGLVRIQTFDKTDDKVQGDYKNSGNASLRWTTLENWNNRLDFKVVLEPNKTYRFNFFYALPHWGEQGWLKIKIANELGEGYDVWGQKILPGWQHWAGWQNSDVIFTTTENNYVMHLYDATRSSNWWNLYFDDFVLYEVNETQPADPQIAGKTNLIVNGDFEDETLNNDGTVYNWALANPDDFSSDYPVAYNEVWGTWVRLQDREKKAADDGVWGDDERSFWEGHEGFDTGKQWAYSGTKSLRFSYLGDFGKARSFQDISGDEYPDAYGLNMNFEKELEPNKTYTFVFWIKSACYNDQGTLKIANGDDVLWSQNMRNKWMNWTRQSITFSTTYANHTLRMFTELNGWFNFYLDDLFLYEEDTYQPELVSVRDTYLAFGKSTGDSNVNVEVEFVELDNSGEFDPDAYYTGIIDAKQPEVNNLRVKSLGGLMTIDVLNPAQVTIYNVVGAQIKQIAVENSLSIQLPAGTYFVKSCMENGKTDTVKILNR